MASLIFKNHLHKRVVGVLCALMGFPASYPMRRAIMRKFLQLGVVAAIALAVVPQAEAQRKYFGFFGSEFIGGDTCIGGCSSNVVMVYVSWPSTGWAQQVASAASRGQKSVVALPEIFFNVSDNDNYVLWSQAEYTSRWNSFTSTVASSGLLGHIVAFYPIDEPFTHTPTSNKAAFANDILTATARIKSTYPSTRIMVTMSQGELAETDPHLMPSPWGGVNGVPADFDLVGIDCYGSFDRCFNSPAGSNYWYSVPDLASRLKAKLTTPGQRMFFVSDGHTCPGDYCGDAGQSQAVKEANLLTRVNAWINLANDPAYNSLVVGFFPYVWASYQGSSHAGWVTGTRDLPTVRDRYAGATGLGADIITAKSNPSGNIDVPGAVPGGNTPVSQGFAVQGWAIDQGALVGTGVDAVNVYAYMWTGYGWGPPTFLGSAAVGGDRGDLPFYFGKAARYAGYNLGTAVGAIPSGHSYQIVVYVHSTTTGAWTAYVRYIDLL
jgi:hypothetical protein